MTLREDFVKSHPDFPLLDLNDPDGVAEFLAEKGWLGEGEHLLRCEKPGEGNMNLTLRVVTNQRQAILKQARPWVEKYDHIPAPWDRMTFERRFYERVASIPEVASRMPRLLASDADAHAILLEDLLGAVDMAGLYGEDRVEERDLLDLGDYLRALHSATGGKPDPAFANREMRALNHQHIFEVPLSKNNGLALERFEPGLAAEAARLRSNGPYVLAVRELGRRYLRDGPCLVHGDYFPGSWLKTENGVRMIDTEFCFYGDAELDLGMAVAHLTLARQEADCSRVLLVMAKDPQTGLEPERVLVARYAAVEIMRRLIGVAQLPIAPSGGLRAELLERSREAMLAGALEPLWE